MENTLQLGNLLKEGTYPEEYTGGKNWTILHGDTLKLVKAFQPGIFDAVITDPPYASGGTKQNERNRTTNQKYSSMKAENALPTFFCNTIFPAPVPLGWHFHKEQDPVPSNLQIPLLLWQAIPTQDSIIAIFFP